MEDTKQFEKTFVRWLSLLKAEQDWKQGNTNPLEKLLDPKEESHAEALQPHMR